MAHKAEILSPLGALYYNTGRYEEALQIYQEAAALQPSQKELRLALVSRMKENEVGNLSTASHRESCSPHASKLELECRNTSTV